MDPLVMDFSSKKCSIADLITKNRRFLFIKSSGLFFWKTTFANRGFFGLFMKDYVFVLEPQQMFLEYSNRSLEYSNIFLEYSKCRGSDDEHSKCARPPTKFTHPGKNKCVSIPSLHIYIYIYTYIYILYYIYIYLVIYI